MSLRPHRNALYLLGGWLLIGCLVALAQLGWTVWGWISLLLGLLLAIDAWWALFPLQLDAERKLPSSLPVGRWATVKLTVHNRSKLLAHLELADHHAGFDANDLLVRDQPLQTTIPRNGWVELEWRLKPLARGDLQLGPLQVRRSSPFRFWQSNDMLPIEETIRIYPNFAAITHYSLLATNNRISQLGIKKRRRRGEGLEFHQLREYRDGDSLRQIDWKATARRGELISREYQDERDQQVIFLLDCSRRMRAHDDELSHFDHALNAMLLLSYVALRQGDAVGMRCFGGASRALSPRKGMDTVNSLLNHCYDLQPSLDTADYVAATDSLCRDQHKRSLVILLTNLRDEDQSELQDSLKLMTHRHLVMIANLHENILDDVCNEPLTSFEQAIDYATSIRLKQARSRTEARLQHQGAQIVSCPPDRLAPRLVNRYLEIKRANLL